MDRLTILVSRLYKAVAPTKYQLVSRLMALVGMISHPVDSTLPSKRSKGSQECKLEGFHLILNH